MTGKPTITHSGLHLVTLTGPVTDELRGLLKAENIVLSVAGPGGEGLQALVTYEQLGRMLDWARERGYEHRRAP